MWRFQNLISLVPSLTLDISIQLTRRRKRLEKMLLPPLSSNRQRRTLAISSHRE